LWLRQDVRDWPARERRACFSPPSRALARSSRSVRIEAECQWSVRAWAAKGRMTRGLQKRPRTWYNAHDVLGLQKDQSLRAGTLAGARTGALSSRCGCLFVTAFMALSGPASWWLLPELNFYFCPAELVAASSLHEPKDSMVTPNLAG